MAPFSRKQKIIVAVVAIIFILSIVLVILLTSRCTNDLPNGTSTESTSLSGTTATDIEQPDAIVFADTAIDQQENFDQIEDFSAFGYPQCPGAVRLYIANAPGKPSSTGGLKTAVPSGDQEQAQLGLKPDLALSSVIIKPLPSPTFIIIPRPVATPTPSPLVTVLNPDAGSSLTAGSTFTLRWTVGSARDVTADVLLSVDGGMTYNSLARGLTDTSSFLLRLPAQSAKRCFFRVEVRVGSAMLGYNLSPEFQIVSPRPTAAPTPTPAPTPEPTITPASPNLEYIPAEGAFIPSGGDATRWFHLEHDVADAASIIWQVSRIPFPCGLDIAPENIPGLLVHGMLPGGATEFAVDFSSLMSQFEVTPGQSPVEGLPNNGSAFETVPGLVILKQDQRALYIRAIAVDAAGKPLGAPGAGAEILFGEPLFDFGSMPAAGVPVETILKLSAPKAPGHGPAAFEELKEKGMAIWAGGNTDWSFSLSNIPTDSVEIDLQLSATPFAGTTMADFYEPAGLVYRSRATGLGYTTVSRTYNWSFSDFAPDAQTLGTGTVRYYMRAVCYVPSGPAGSVRPVISITIPIYYTGDVKVLAAIAYDPPEPEPEEVLVESYVPYTEFLRYIPVQWPIPDSSKYFEVTRPIQAEEMNFSIKNDKTGDFLLPYPVHMNLYPQTTRAQYQEVLDRMLPVGAWFHLTLTQSAWDAFWNEFMDLLTQTYNAVRNAYNNLKYTAAVFVADRFTFLGDDVRDLIEDAVIKLIETGLASIGLPPSLPNFETLAENGLDYCLKVALAETSAQMGVPLDQIPLSVQDEITQDLKNRLKSVALLNQANPIDVDFLKPAAKAMYSPAYVDVKVNNVRGRISPSGTLTVSFYPVDKPHYKFYKYVTLPVPPLQPGESTVIRVYLRQDNTDYIDLYKQYYFGEIGDSRLTISVKYDVPDVRDAALSQGKSGSDPNRPDEYVYDHDPVYEFRAALAPANEIYPQHRLD